MESEEALPLIFRVHIVSPAKSMGLSISSELSSCQMERKITKKKERGRLTKPEALLKLSRVCRTLGLGCKVDIKYKKINDPVGPLGGLGKWLMCG